MGQRRRAGGGEKHEGIRKSGRGSYEKCFFWPIPDGW